MLVATHHLGSRTWGAVPLDDIHAWLRTMPPEHVLLATARHVALALAYWLVASTAVYVVAATGRWTRVVGIVGRLTLPVVRRTVDRVVGTAVLVALPVNAAAAQAMTASVTVTSAPATAASGDAPPRLDPAGPRWPPVAPPPSPAAPTNALHGAEPQVEHVVVAGEHLWSIAQAHLETVQGRPPELAELDPYWRRVIEHNRGRIRSGDPDLIYPDEVIELP